MKLLSITINKIDSTSFYRASGVFGPLQKQTDLHVFTHDLSKLNGLNWSDLVAFDAVFMQRPYGEIAVNLAQYVKGMNIPLWIDYDDNLFEMPLDNISSDIFNAPAIKTSLTMLASLADVVTVSTVALKTLYDKLAANVVVVPNAINTDILPPRNTKTPRTSVVWRGSNTHQLDLMSYANELLITINRYPDNDFIFFGFNPWFFPDMPNRKYIKPTDPMFYFRQLNAIAPLAVHVPLADTHFNHCKSNIAYIEATYAGAVCIVPDWTEWQRPGTLRYNSPEQYAELISSVLKGDVSTQKCINQAWDYINSNLRLDIVNRQRLEILENITLK